LSILLQFRKTLTLPQAAQYLTDTLKEPVLENDVLEFTLAGHLVGSIIFTSVVYGRILSTEQEYTDYLEDLINASDDEQSSFLGHLEESLEEQFPEKLTTDDAHFMEMLVKAVSIDDPQQSLDEFKRACHASSIAGNGGVSMVDQYLVEPLLGCYDLTLRGAETSILNAILYSEVSNAGSMIDSNKRYYGDLGLIVRDPETGITYELQKQVDFNEQGDPIFTGSGVVQEFPKASPLVFRVEHLESFKNKALESAPSANDKVKMFDQISNESVMEAVALMAKILASKRASFKSGEQINAKVMAEAVQAEADSFLANGTATHKGISNFQKVISTSIKYVNKHI
jgi:hypothetical protein